MIFAARKVFLPIPRGARVLEVGSGDSPSPRADVLLDLTLRNRERVGGPTVIDRPFVISQVERLPFRDKAFDYVIAFHVLEHSPNPDLFLSELQRVARAGYIETPSFWAECVQPMRMHRLQVGIEFDEDGPLLLIRKKTSPVPDPELARAFDLKLKSTAALRAMPPDAWVSRYHWNGRIRWRVSNPEAEISWELSPDATFADDYNPRSYSRRAMIAATSLVFAAARKFRR
jgi:SAM-dependent methyltransferase